MAGAHRKRQHEEDSSDEAPIQQMTHPLLFQLPNEPPAEFSIYPEPSGLRNVIAMSHYDPSYLRPPPPKRWQDSYVDLRERIEHQMEAEFITFLNTFGPNRRRRPMTPRPKKCSSNFNYQPRRIFHGDITATVSVYRHDTSIYIPSELTFNEPSTALVFKMRATTTLYLMKRAQECKLCMRAAILGLYLMRYSVCILRNNLPVQHLDNAVKSFPHDVLGKWCFPGGDTVIMVNFYAEPNCVNTALMNLIDAMKAIDELDGAYTSTNDPLSASEAILENHQTCLIEGENNFKVIAPEPLSLIFKPVFTQQSYNMGSAKNRMAAEVLQDAILVFIHMIEKTLASDNVGAALYLAQCMHGLSLLLHFLISDESLTSHYLLTMPNWYLGRCCVLAATNWRATRQTKADQHTDAQERLGAFHVRFFGQLLTAYNTNTPKWCTQLHCARSFYFPKTITECFAHASEATNAIQAPRGWLRTRIVDLYARAIHNHLQLIKFEKKVEWTRNKIEKNVARNTILEICEDLHYILNFSIEEQNCKVFLLNLLAKSLKYRASCLSLHFFIRRNLSKHEVGRIPYVDIATKKQSVEQHCALALFNKVCQDTYYKGSRQVLLQMAEMTFADEILSQIHAADDQYLTSGIDAIISLLPAVFAMWLQKLPKGLEQQSPQINEMDIPDFEIKHFFNIMGMMYNGTAVLYCLMARGVQDNRRKEAFINNAKYFHALSCICMRHIHVVYFILRNYADYILKYERCLLNNNYTADKIPKGSTLALSLLFHYLLVLPVLWELSIVTDRTHGPQNCESIAINHMMLPIPLDNIPGVLTENERRLYSDVLEQLKTETGFEEGNVMIVSYTATSEPTVLTYTPHDFTHDVNINTAVREFPNCRDCRPMAWGNDDCTSQECQVEQYHYEDELKWKMDDNFWIRRYPKLFSKVDENRRTPEENLKYQLQCVSRSLYKIMSKAIHEVNNLRDNTPQNIAVTIKVDGGQYTTNIPVARALHHLCEARDLLLNSGVTSPVSITRALARVDEALNEGRTLVMLRGSINTEL